MKATPTKRKPRAKFQKIYTFDVICSINLQYSFTESEVEQDSEGREGDLCSTEEALHSLEKELAEILCMNYPISKLEAYADSDELLGVAESPVAPPGDRTMHVWKKKPSRKKS